MPPTITLTTSPQRHSSQFIDEVNPFRHRTLAPPSPGEQPARPLSAPAAGFSFRRSLSFRHSRKNTNTPPSIVCTPVAVIHEPVEDPLAAAGAALVSPTQSEDQGTEMLKLHPASAETRATEDGQPLLGGPFASPSEGTDIRRRPSRRERGAAMLNRALSRRGGGRHPAHHRSVSTSALPPVDQANFPPQSPKREYHVEMDYYSSLAYCDGMRFDEYEEMDYS